MSGRNIPFTSDVIASARAGDAVRRFRCGAHTGPARSLPIHQPRTELARVQPACARSGDRRSPSAARAGQVPRERAVQMMRDQAACWQDLLRPALAEAGVTFLDEDQYTDRVRRQLAAYFKSDVFPLLTPLAFDPGHPFPQISNRSKNFAVAVHHNRRTKFARVKIPDILPRFVPVPSTDGP